MRVRCKEGNPQYHHALRYKQTLRRWKAANMADAVCHELAAVEARESFPLSDAEQAEVDAWLDKTYPGRKRERPREDYPSVFDDLPQV